MGPKIKRRNYFVHPSSQLKYIAMSILPAFLMSGFCIFFLFKSGEVILYKEMSTLTLEISSLNDSIYQLESGNYPSSLKVKLEVLGKKLANFREGLKIRHYATLREWSMTKISLVFTLLLILICISIISLLFSHRIAGPMFRIHKTIVALCEGKDTQPIRLRGYDEFKEVAVSLDKLRAILKQKGLLTRPEQPS